MEEISSSGGPGVGLMEPLTEAELWLCVHGTREMVLEGSWSLAYYLAESHPGETTEKNA